MTQLRIDIITALPEMFDNVLNTSIVRISQEKSIVEIHTHNLHDYAEDKFKHIDDTPYGGGSGMLIQCMPIFSCIEQLTAEREYDEIIYMTADGETLNQSTANGLSLCKNLIILCGHYKGIDQRVRDSLITKEVSIGDYVLSGGELPAMVLLDSIVRLIPGVIGSAESALDDSYQNGLLDPPWYTKPAVFREMEVPKVLQNGNMKDIQNWRLEKSIEKTQQRRPDLMD